MREKNTGNVGEGAPIRFNAGWNVATRGRTFDHQDTHGIASLLGGEAFLRIFRVHPLRQPTSNRTSELRLHLLTVTGFFGAPWTSPSL